jgi:hypothetical protein
MNLIRHPLDDWRPTVTSCEKKSNRTCRHGD